MSRCIKIGAVCACGILCGIAAFGGAAVASLPPPKMDWRFGSDAKSLNAGNFGNALDIETVREGDGFALRVSNRRSPKYPWKTPDGRTVMREVDTAWRIESKTFDVKPGAEFAVRVRASCVDSVPMAVASPPPAVMLFRIVRAEPPFVTLIRVPNASKAIAFIYPQSFNRFFPFIHDT